MPSRVMTMERAWERSWADAETEIRSSARVSFRSMVKSCVAGRERILGDGLQVQRLGLTPRLVVPEVAADQHDQFGGEKDHQETFAAAGAAQIAEHVVLEIVDEGDRRRVGSRECRHAQSG